MPTFAGPARFTSRANMPGGRGLAVDCVVLDLACRRRDLQKPFCLLQANDKEGVGSEGMCSEPSPFFPCFLYVKRRRLTQALAP